VHGQYLHVRSQIKIDGSERAKRIAAEALDRVTDLAAA
jgi:hypothetical protein